MLITKKSLSVKKTCGSILLSLFGAQTSGNISSHTWHCERPNLTPRRPLPFFRENPPACTLSSLSSSQEVQSKLSKINFRSAKINRGKVFEGAEIFKIKICRTWESSSPLSCTELIKSTPSGLERAAWKLYSLESVVYPYLAAPSETIALQTPKWKEPLARAPNHQVIVTAASWRGKKIATRKQALLGNNVSIKCEIFAPSPS